MNKDNNVRLVHETAYSPDPLYAKKPLGWYVGRHVKMAFQAADSRVEHMWIAVTGVEGDYLVGTVENDPYVVSHVKYGDKVSLSRTQVEAVAYSRDEWMAEAAHLAAQGDYFNRHRGSPTKPGSGFEQLFEIGMTPRQALKKWTNWSPVDDME